jgi:hypothetical protein
MSWQDSENPSEDGEYTHPPEPLSAEDLKATTEIVNFLEYDLEIDVRRLQVQVRSGHLHIQGSVESREQKNSLEEVIREFQNGRHGITSFETFLTILE